ncbi:MAG: hypothetical protein RLZZ157_1146 [Pseudomonadota bacterium]|jgi:D-alanyl-D-alanine carboxypeptidase
MMAFLVACAWVIFALAVVVAGVLFYRAGLGDGKIKPRPQEPPTAKPDDSPATEAKKPAPKPAQKPKKPADTEGDKTTGTRIAICPGVTSKTAILSPDGRFYGHFPYEAASGDQLSEPPAGFGGPSCTGLHGEAKVALAQLLDAAKAQDAALGDAMVGLSCFRSISYQRKVFCRKIGDGFAARAKSSAPPGYSEHATGYALDFGDRNHPECDLRPCFADTPVGQWLQDNASSYGFVLSFPKGNAQGVTYEPWHWRYEGSDRAKTVFAAAKS